MHVLFRILHLIFYKYIFIFCYVFNSPKNATKMLVKKATLKSPSEVHAVKARSVRCSVKKSLVRSKLGKSFDGSCSKPESPPEIVFVRSPARSGPEKVWPGPPEARKKPGSHSTSSLTRLHEWIQKN